MGATRANSFGLLPRRLRLAAGLTQEAQRLSPTQSPRDFAARLSVAWMDPSGAVDDLTGRYVADRYGECSTEEDLTTARQVRERIHQAFTTGKP